MTIKKVPTDYEICFRIAGRGSRTYKCILPTKGEYNCQPFHDEWRQYTDLTKGARPQ